MTTLTALLVSARVLVGDSATDNLARNENMDNDDIGNTLDGNNVTFGTLNYPIVPGGEVAVVVDGSALENGSDYTVNEATGQFIFASPPTQTAYATYYYYLFADSVWTEFVTWATERLNVSTGSVSSDVSVIPDGLLSAVKLYTCAAWARRIAAQTGLWYNQKLQEREENRESISKKFSALAVQWEKDGDAARDSYYDGAGTQLKPAMSIVQHIPRPYTPSR